MSEALLKSGMGEQDGTKCYGTCSTKHKGKHVIRAQDLANSLKSKPPQGCSMLPKLTGKNYKNKLKDKKGIIFFKDYWQRPSDKGKTRTGDHIDLWNKGDLASQNAVENFLTGTLGLYYDGVYSNKELSSEVWFWECKD